MAHLDGRMPHREVDSLFAAASKAKSQEDVAALLRKVAHVSALFAATVREFRSSVPANERKRGLPPVNDGARQPSGWRPMAETFAAGELSYGEVCGFGFKDWTLQSWCDEGVGGYDGRASAVITLVRHDRLHTVRQLVRGGVDLGRLARQPAPVGGGLGLLLEDVGTYIWLNQLLLMDEGPWRLPGRYVQQLPQSRSDPADAREVRRLAAFRCLAEHCHDYDNRDFRRAQHVEDLRQRLASPDGLDREALREYLKEHLFPDIYRGAHALLYNAVCHHGVPPAALEDPAAADAPGFDMQAAAAVALCHVLKKAVPPIQGVKRGEMAEALAGESAAHKCFQPM